MIGRRSIFHALVQGFESSQAIGLSILSRFSANDWFVNRIGIDLESGKRRAPRPLVPSDILENRMLQSSCIGSFYYNTLAFHVKILCSSTCH